MMQFRSFINFDLINGYVPLPSKNYVAFFRRLFSAIFIFVNIIAMLIELLEESAEKVRSHKYT